MTTDILYDHATVLYNDEDVSYDGDELAASTWGWRGNAVASTTLTDAFRSAAGAESDNAAGTLTVTAPTGIVVGDLLVCFALFGAVTSSIPMPSGWTRVSDDLVLLDSSPDQILVTSYIIATSTEAAAGSFAVDAAAGRAAGAIIACFDATKLGASVTNTDLNVGGIEDIQTSVASIASLTAVNTLTDALTFYIVGGRSSVPGFVSTSNITTTDAALTQIETTRGGTGPGGAGANNVSVGLAVWYRYNSGTVPASTFNYDITTARANVGIWVPGVARTTPQDTWQVIS